MTQKHTWRGFTHVKRVGQALPDNAPVKGHTAAFTLIELLVVVLIIGILAAVAVPQYQKSVEKSKATQALALIKTLVQAQDAYYLSNGQYATQFDQLDVDIPWTGHTAHRPHNFSHQIMDTRSNEDWSVQLYSDMLGNVVTLFVGRINGPYQGSEFNYYFADNYHDGMPTHKILCAEINSGITHFFQKPAGTYCQKIMNGKLIPGFTDRYVLPY